MADFKIVLNDPKTGKSYQKEIKEPDSESLVGKKIGEVIRGEVIDMPGYEFEITGGSDSAGFPMRKELDGSGIRKVLAVEGVGLKRKTSKTKKGKLKFHGIKLRKTVSGNTISGNTAQINMKITKFGKESLEKPAEEAEAPKEEAAPAENKPAAEEAIKEEPKTEEKAEEKKE